MGKLHAGQVFRFADFEVRLRSGELMRQGSKIHLQERPFQLLAMLLERQGDMVSREELCEALWPAGTFVNFDQSLNIAVAKLRRALGDSAENPAFVETVASRGYRFIANAQRSDRKIKSPGDSADRSAIRLAVLPFQTRETDSRQSFFADGLTDELIVQLGQLYPHQLSVIARTSSSRYRGTSKPVRQIGRELKVDYILEGGVRGGEDRIRITAELIHASDEAQVWAEAFDYPAGDFIGVQNAVAASIARALQLELLPAQARTFTQHAPNIKAYLCYLKGRHHLLKRTEEGLQRSTEYFENAILEDPQYDLAYSALAESYLYLTLMGYGIPRELFTRTREAASRALAINDNLSEAHAYLGAVKYLYDWDWPAAEKLFRRALELNPGNASAHRLYGQYLSRQGRHEEGFSEIQRALEFDPLAMMTNATLFSILYNSRRYEEAFTEVLKVLELEPRSAPALMFLGLLHEQRGTFAEAVAAISREIEHHPTNCLALGHLGHVYGQMGNAEQAYGVLSELQRISEAHYVPAFCSALVFLGLGDFQETLCFLEKAYQERSPFLAFFLGPDPRFDKIRAVPEFQALMARIGLPTDSSNHPDKNAPPV